MVDDLVDFVRGPGFVLDFSDPSFAEFFDSELQINIDDPKYAVRGGSKGKRLRYFLQTCDDKTAVRALSALWEHRSDYLQRNSVNDPIVDAQSRYQTLINRLSGVTTKTADQPSSEQVVDRQKFADAKAKLFHVTALEPQKRGFALERFLKELFDTFGLAARKPFRLRGEQIDGSFQLANETYLLEAKWQNQQVGVADLHTFHGKIEQKAAWTRGIFISTSGFTNDGLHAFGRGKRIVCMDGLDLYEMLDREISLNLVLELKVRRAAETGMPFLRVRELFQT